MMEGYGTTKEFLSPTPRTQRNVGRILNMKYGIFSLTVLGSSSKLFRPSISYGPTRTAVVAISTATDDTDKSTATTTS